MMTLKKLAALFVAIVLIVTGLVWLRANRRERKRQVAYQAVVAMYSRDLSPETTRDDVEQYVRSHGAQPESDQQPSSPKVHDIMVRLGEQRPPWFCNRVIVFLRLEFDNTGKYRGASLKPEPQQCL
jgi:hypothetical protein